MNRKNFLYNAFLSSSFLFAPGFKKDFLIRESMDSLPDYKELQYHKIALIKSKQIKMTWPRLVGKNSVKDIHGWGPTLTVYEITTDKGAVGWGTGKQTNIASSLSYLSGKSVSDLFIPSVGITDNTAIPFDISLHDLAGKILNKPVYKLLGANKPICVKCYSGQLCFDDLEPPEKPTGINALVRDCEWDYKYGYRQFKLKIGRGFKWMPEKEGIKRDIDVTRTIAQMFPDCDILVDANDGYSPETLIRYLEGIADIKLFWIEEPFRETLKDYTQLKNWLTANYKFKVLLADGEAAPDLNLATELGRKGLLDVYIEDILGLGFTKWRKLNPELKDKRIQASPHCFGDLLKTYYTSHLVAAQGNAPTIEGVTCTSEEVDFGDYKLKDGKLIPSTDPGFGMKLLI